MDLVKIGRYNGKTVWQAVVSEAESLRAEAKAKVDAEEWLDEMDALIEESGELLAKLKAK